MLQGTIVSFHTHTCGTLCGKGSNAVAFQKLRRRANPYQDAASERLSYNVVLFFKRETNVAITILYLTDIK
jgi:hypothetical protein